MIRDHETMARWHSYRWLVCFYVTLLIFGFRPSDGLRFGYWWDLAFLSSQRSKAYIIAAQPMCQSLYSLTPSQAKLCEHFFDHMPSVSFGAHIGVKECQRQFKNRRWNCSSTKDGLAFGATVDTATRESSFVHAISTAGVVHSISRSCRRGMLGTCGCRAVKRPRDLDKTWHWNGCGDNLHYATRFAENFIDIREREKNYPRHSKHLARMLMNLHNNEVGRLTVASMLAIGCKCHGVSGSCSLKTCWQTLLPFERIGAVLSKRYENAVKVKFNKRGTALRCANCKSNRLRRRQLIYIHESPDFCHRNSSSGIPGTHGRLCNPESTRENSCESLCCGRGYISTMEIKEYECRCKFRWCCKVVCQRCLKRVISHLCK